MALTISALRRTALTAPVIIGGGPAGAAAAIVLARAGQAVTLIERNQGPSHKVCGDFLSADALAALENLGVDISAASAVTSVRLVHRNRIVSTDLPFAARGLSRLALDETLLRQAQAAGASVVRGHRVGSMQRDGPFMRLNCGSFGSILTDNVFLATGKHDLQGAQRAGRRSAMVGLKMYYKLSAPQRSALLGHVELFLSMGGYIGLQLVEVDRAVLCMLLPSFRLRSVSGQWDRMLGMLTDDCPLLRERLSGAQALLDRPLAVASLPYGYVYTPKQGDSPGLFRVGDQAAVIASLTGDGVALALASGTLAAQTFLAGRAARDHHHDLRKALTVQMRLSSTIHRMATTVGLQAWVAFVCGLCPAAVRLAAAATRAKQFDR